MKGIPKKDGSGGGMRLNKGRGGCDVTNQEDFGKGRLISQESLFERKIKTPFKEE